MPGSKPINSPSEEHKNAQMDKFFSHLLDTVVDGIKIDHLMITENVAPPETKEFYEGLQSGDAIRTLGSVRKMSSEVFIKSIVKDYITELGSFQRKPLKLALALSDSKLLVWSEIKDNDEKTEDALLLAEAKVNAKYHKSGFYLNSTVIEKSDNLKIPPHYLTIIE